MTQNQTKATAAPYWPSELAAHDILLKPLDLSLGNPKHHVPNEAVIFGTRNTITNETNPSINMGFLNSESILKPDRGFISWFLWQGYTM
jgi:hypothetical protein